MYAGFNKRRRLILGARIIQYFRELGCAVTTMTESEMARWKLSKAEAKTRKVARLRLPLDFPRVRAPAGRRR